LHREAKGKRQKKTKKKKVSQEAKGKRQKKKQKKKS
jgi:hypothetical protein